LRIFCAEAGKIRRNQVFGRELTRDAQNAGAGARAAAEMGGKKPYPTTDLNKW